MATKHTPGPWTYTEDGGEHFTFGNEPPKAEQHRYAIDMPLGEVFTSNDSAPDRLGREEARANVRLIAAAPDLLETARALNQAIYEQQEYSPSNAVVTANLALRAAIAKAEGR